MSSYACTLTTSTASDTLVADASPDATADGKARLTWSCDTAGRGVSVGIQPLTADAQFVLHRVNISVVPTSAGPED